MNILQVGCDGSIGVASYEGNYYPTGTKCRGSIKNRIFAPKWVEQAWNQGLLVQVDEISLRLNEKGRYYAIVRGTAFKDKVVSQKVELVPDEFKIVDTYLSGRQETNSRFHVMNWRRAPQWAKEHPRFEEKVRAYRLRKILYGRYNPNVKTLNYLNGVEISKEVVKFDNGVYNAEVRTSFIYDCTYIVHSIKGDRIVAEEVLSSVEKEYTHQVPVEYLFNVERIDMGTELKYKVHRSADYESNDGRSTRYDEWDTVYQYRVTKVILTPKVEWVKPSAWICRDTLFSVVVQDSF
jgi:hypothetical protein